MQKKKHFKFNRRAIFLLIGTIVIVLLLIIGGVFLLNIIKSTKNKPISANQEEKVVLLSEAKTSNTEIEAKLEKMTLEEKVAQLFIITPEQLTGYEEVSAAGEATEQAINNYPVGGVILFDRNLVSQDQVIEMNQNIQKYSENRIEIPMFISVDEEGGEVARIANNEAFEVVQYSSMKDIGDSGDKKNAYEVGKAIGKYLSQLQFNLDLAPDADVLSEGSETFIGGRSFGSDPVLVGEMASEVILGLHENNIKSTLKHFPGLGSSNGDTHLGYDVINKSLTDMEKTDFKPFEAGIYAGADFVMVSHISVPEIIGDDTPSSLSKVMITDILRGNLGFDGLIITDALNMGAITEKFSSEEAAIETFNAGADILLMPDNFIEAYNGIINAVKSGQISEERLDESVIRILKSKETLIV